MIMPEPKTLALVLPEWENFLAEVDLPYPWALIPVADQPLLAHWLDYALDAGYARVEVLGNQPQPAIAQWLEAATLWPLERVFRPLQDGATPPQDAPELRTLPGMLGANQLVDTPWDLVCLRQTLEQERLENIPAEDRVGPGCVIAEDVELNGPFWIGANVTIEPGVQVHPYTVIAAGSVVGAHASLADCRLEASMQVGPFTHFDGHWAGPGFLLNQAKQIQHHHPDPHIVRAIGSS